MISLDELRHLEPTLADMNDEDLSEIRTELYALGQLAFDVWQREQTGSNYPQGVVTPDPSNSTIDI